MAIIWELYCIVRVISEVWKGNDATESQESKPLGSNDSSAVKTHRGSFISRNCTRRVSARDFCLLLRNASHPLPEPRRAQPLRLEPSGRVDQDHLRYRRHIRCRRLSPENGRASGRTPNRTDG